MAVLHGRLNLVGHGLIQALAQVGDRWRLQQHAQPPMRFVRAQSGTPLRLALVEEESGQSVHFSELRVEAGPGGTVTLVDTYGNATELTIG